jgi:hypothetical protein
VRPAWAMTRNTPPVFVSFETLLGIYEIKFPGRMTRRSEAQAAESDRLIQQVMVGLLDPIFF